MNKYNSGFLCKHNPISCDIIEKLEDVYISNCKTPHLDKYAKAILIKEIIARRKITAREFGRLHNIPKATLCDWLNFAKVTPEQHARLVEAGFTEVEIRRSLVNNQKENISQLKHLDFEIQVLISKLNSGTIKKNSSDKTLENLNLLEKAISTAKYRLLKE